MKILSKKKITEIFDTPKGLDGKIHKISFNEISKTGAFFLHLDFRDSGHIVSISHAFHFANHGTDKK